MFNAKVSELRKQGLEIVVPGKPKGKKAPGGVQHRYNASRQDMEHFEAVARQQIPDCHKTYRGAVSMRIRAFFNRPDVHFKRHKRGLSASAPADHTQKPDCDNIAKLVGDSLNGVAYHDDAQVNDLKVTKEWTEEEDERVEVDLSYKL